MTDTQTNYCMPSAHAHRGIITGIDCNLGQVVILQNTQVNVLLNPRAESERLSIHSRVYSVYAPGRHWIAYLSPSITY